MLFCHVTTKVEGDPYPKLLSEKGFNAFPTLAWMDESGDVLLKQPGNERTVAGFKKSLETLKAQLDLKKKASSGDKSAAADLLITEIGLGKYDFDTATAKVKELKLEGDQLKKAQAGLTDLEVTTWAKKVPTNLRDPKREEAVLETAKHFRAMRKAGHVPSGAAARPFWGMLLNGAKAEKDAKSFEELLGDAKKHLPDDAPTKALLDRAEKDLAALKGG